MNYSIDIKTYTSPVNEAAVAAIVKHLGIALRNRDSSLVSSSDKSELDRVRESWLKKKLQLAHSDTDLDKAIADVMTRMKSAHSKSRVTVYYLLAETFNKLGVLAG